MMLIWVYQRQKQNANSVDPDEMAHYEPSHLDLPVCIGICFDILS